MSSTLKVKFGEGVCGKLNELFAVSINLSLEITLELLISGKEIIPIDVGIQNQNPNTGYQL